MNYSEAMRAARFGSRVARKSWDAMHVVFRPRGDISIGGEVLLSVPHLLMIATHGATIWHPSPADEQAGDWGIVPWIKSNNTGSPL